MKAAVFSCKGLGDGLLALVLAHNLSQNGFATTLFHGLLPGMHSWFPALSLSAFPESGAIPEVLSHYDRYFIIYENSPWMQAILTHCQSYFPEKTTILNPIATPNRDYPYWEQGRFDGTKSFAENLYLFCKEQLKLPHNSRQNGIAPPAAIISRRYPSRVIIHPTSSRAGKNWSAKKYQQLAQELKKLQFDPMFVLGESEKQGWEGENTCSFASLEELAAFVAESGYMIGNDSGIGHLASCLGLPTLTICRSKMAADFWRPSWSPGDIVVPPNWIPNLKGLRLRDQHWQKFVSLRTVLTKFHALSGL